MAKVMSAQNKLKDAHSPDRLRQDTNTTAFIRADGRFPEAPADGEQAQHAPGQAQVGFQRGTRLVPRGAATVAAALPTKMRVLFITEDDPLYVIQFFDVFFDIYPRDEIDICGITIDRAFHEPLRKTLRRMLGFYGPWGVFRQG